MSADTLEIISNKEVIAVNKGDAISCCTVAPLDSSWYWFHVAYMYIFTYVYQIRLAYKQRKLGGWVIKR